MSKSEIFRKSVLSGKSVIEPIDKLSPHLAIPTDERVHVIPVSLVEKWISGAKTAPKDVIRQIIKEWLNEK